MKPKDLEIIRRTNANDVHCVSWILRNITDPEALDAAIRLAGVVRWFDDGTNDNLPYDLIVSTYEACFDSARKLYPGSRDRAYYSGRAIVWIRTLAMCKSEEFASRFPPHDTAYKTRGLDPDLKNILQVNAWAWAIGQLTIDLEHTPSHSEWVSDVLLRHYWADRTGLDPEGILDRISDTIETNTSLPLNAILNRLLVWCIFLGLPAGEEVLEIQDKSYDTPIFTLQVTHSALHQ